MGDLNAFMTGRTVAGGADDSWKHPAMLLGDSLSWCEVSGLDHLALYGIEDTRKDLGFGMGNASLKMTAENGEHGFLFSCRNDARSLSWPFTDDVRVNGSRNAAVLLGSVFAGDSRWFSAGLTAGKQISDGSGWLYAAQVTGRAPWGIRGCLGVSSLPVEWDIDAYFKSTVTTLPAEIRSTTVEGEVVFPARTLADVTVHGSVGELNAPDTFHDSLDTHAQVMDIDTGAWGVGLRENALSHGALNAGYDAFILDGDYELRFDGAQYARCVPCVDGYRLWGTFASSKLPFHVHEVALNRVSADLGLRYGRADSWPFTPSQIEIVGDKTWTFSGTGRVVSNAVTLTWRSARSSSLSISGGRAYLDYRLKIVTRDHLSANPLDMLLGTRRTEIDKTRYADFALLYYAKEFRKNRVSVFTEFQQIVPLRHVRKKSEGGTGNEDSLSNVEFKMPEYYGGLSLLVKLRYFL